MVGGRCASSGFYTSRFFFTSTAVIILAAETSLNDQSDIQAVPRAFGEDRG